MATLFKLQQKHAAKIEAKEREGNTKVNGKPEAKRPREEDEEMADIDMSGPPKKRRNKQRVLILSSRGVTQRMRHLMNDLEALLPQVKKGGSGHSASSLCSEAEQGGVNLESKFDAKSKLHMLSELSYLHNCNNTLFFEARRHEDLYMWAVKSPNGPSIRMHVQNIHTMDELKMTGNCLRGSRGIVSFDAAFDQSEWGRLTKEVFTHVSCSWWCLQAILGS
jgi:ribosome biogenesis protein BRX1